MKSYQCVSNETVLLVGEGNFSFTKDFLNFNNSIGLYPKVVASCFESDTSLFSNLKLDNISYIEEKGKSCIY